MRALSVFRWSEPDRILRAVHQRWLLLTCLALLLGACFANALRPIDDHLAAWRSNILQRAPSGQVVVVEIDSASLQAAGRWPWPRERFAQAIANLNEAGASLIAFDVDFDMQSDADNDRALASAIDASAPGAIVLPTFVQPGSEIENTPLAALSQTAAIASVNIPVDADGVVRRYARGYVHSDHYHQSVGAVIAESGYGDSSAFLIDYGIRLRDLPRLSFDQVYRGDFSAEDVRGRRIIVGATALELGDEFATPQDPSTPGVYLHALAAESLLQRRALTEPSPALVLAGALFVFWLLWPRRELHSSGQMLIRHLIVAPAIVAGPLALQAAAPISMNVSLALLAQILCMVAATQRELARRAAEVIEEREAALHHAALHDSETELPNRRAMLLELERALNGANDVLAVAIGIDRFAMLRAAIGYANANTTIARLAQNVAAARGCEVFNLSTGILGVVLTGERGQASRLAAGFVDDRTLRTIEIGGQEIELGLKIGAAPAPRNGVLPHLLLEQAVIALDQARMDNVRAVEFDQATFPDPKVRLALASDISKGTQRGDFWLAYQLKAAAHTGAFSGAEVLVRWRHPEHGPLAPDRFIGLAEETGAIADLTRWVIEQTLRDQALLKRAGIDLVLSVNLSGRLLIDYEFCKSAIEAFERADAKICLEITETAIISDPAAAIASIAAFQAAGVEIAIDDYGAGLSSLAYLKQIAADELKLDKSLVRDIAWSERDRVIVKSTLDLAHSLGMTVVAEGVEDEATRGVLVELGCDTIQGYLVARPSSLADVIELLQPSGARVE